MSLHKGDKSAAFVGLIGGAITILLLVYGMVLLTNASFEGHEGAAPAAEHDGH
jgi:hypothetical protein